MRAIRIHGPGGPEVLTLEEIERPAPARGEIRVRIGAIGVNFIDIYHRTGLYPQTYPFIPGQEGAGVVDAVGDGVEGIREGDRVAWASVTGSYAEAQLIPAERAVPIPPGVSDELGAAVMLQGMTAHYLCHSTFPVTKETVCLVHAAAGGVGLLLVQMVKMRGGVVYGTVSTEEKAALAREAGADEVIRYTEVSVEEEVHRLSGGRGVDVVFDSVGKTTFEGSMRSLRRRGMLVSYGQSSGAVPPLDVVSLSRAGSLYLTRPTLGHYTADREELLWRAEDILRWIGEGRLEVRIDSRFPLERAGDAQRRIESRGSRGKILIVP